MSFHNDEQQEQNTNHSFDIKPSEPTHPIYMTSQFTQRQQGVQKISQSIDFTNIAILIFGKALAIVLYFLLSDFKLLDFIFVLLIISIDFWVNKNIHGKQLSGLRWWVEFNQTSEEEEWIFESADPNVQINNINDGFFWIVNLVAAGFWFVNLIVISIITSTLFWIGLCMFCFGITFVNLACFYKCRGQHQKKLQEIIEKVGLKSATTLIARAENMNEESMQDAKFQIE